MGEMGSCTSTPTETPIRDPPAPAPWSGKGPPPYRHPDTLNTLIEVSYSEDKGLGLFALVDIPTNKIVVCERPILIVSKYSLGADLDDEVRAMPEDEQMTFLGMTAHLRDSDTLEMNGRERIVDCNSFALDDDESGMFKTAGTANHSCMANCSYGWYGEIGSIVIWSTRKILKGEEITIDYGHTKSRLLSNYGFDCDCGYCRES